MKIIRVRNAHEGLPEGIRLLREIGVKRGSRNGEVIVSPEPVTTIFLHPTERVIQWPQRDANPFLHLYESLWMLMGRNDVAPLLRYTKQFAEYSDNGEILHGAYGYRWRHSFGKDQLEIIIDRLTRNHDDRRCVLQMWDASQDLGLAGKDVPCNLMTTFQIDEHGCLDMTVFNRSNDIIWGLYGANCVHFSVLQEYIARSVGVPTGTYTHVSVNFHAYTSILDKMPYIPPNDGLYGNGLKCPYSTGQVYPVHMIWNIDHVIRTIFRQEPFEVIRTSNMPLWADVALTMLHAHHVATVKKDLPEAIAILNRHDNKIDWIASGLDWLRRRLDRQILRAARDGETLGEA